MDELISIKQKGYCDYFEDKRKGLEGEEFVISKLIGKKDIEVYTALNKHKHIPFDFLMYSLKKEKLYRCEVKNNLRNESEICVELISTKKWDGWIFNDDKLDYYFFCKSDKYNHIYMVDAYSLKDYVKQNFNELVKKLKMNKPTNYKYRSGYIVLNIESLKNKISFIKI